MLLNLAPDQGFAVLLAIAVGAGAGVWLWWISSARRAEYSTIEAANEARRKARAIQADIRARMVEL